MDSGDDNNPFANSAIRQATAPTLTNQQNNESNPSTNTTTPAQPAPAVPQQPSAAAFLQSPPPAYQPSAYTPVPTPVPVQQPTATRVDLTDYEKRQAELEKREKIIAERERALASDGLAGNRENNFPPLPKICPCRPCFYQDISTDIPIEFQRWVRYLYFLWIFYAFTLLLNMIAALSYFLVDKGGAPTFGLSLFYLLFFAPISYICWFRPIYRAFREDSASSFMIFFFVFFMQFVITILQFLGVANLGCGFILMIKLFSSGGSKIIAGLLVMIVTFSFAIIAIVDGLLLIKVHRLYRQSGASLEQAQKELQTAFVNSPTVRGAAREIATAGINEALSHENDQRPIY